MLYRRFVTIACPKLGKLLFIMSEPYYLPHDAGVSFWFCEELKHKMLSIYQLNSVPAFGIECNSCDLVNYDKGDHPGSQPFAINDLARRSYLYQVG